MLLVGANEQERKTEAKDPSIQACYASNSILDLQGPLAMLASIIKHWPKSLPTRTTKQQSRCSLSCFGFSLICILQPFRHVAHIWHSTLFLASFCYSLLFFFAYQSKIGYSQSLFTLRFLPDQACSHLFFYSSTLTITVKLTVPI